MILTVTFAFETCFIASFVNDELVIAKIIKISLPDFKAKDKVSFSHSTKTEKILETISEATCICP